jgi:hypothetical protein
MLQVFLGSFIDDLLGTNGGREGLHEFRDACLTIAGRAPAAALRIPERVGAFRQRSVERVTSTREGA